MKIILTTQEITTMGFWDEFCTLRGLNPWSKKMGLVSGEEEFSFTKQECDNLNIFDKIKYLPTNEYK